MKRLTVTIRVSIFISSVCLLLAACSPVKTYRVTSDSVTADLFNDSLIGPEEKTRSIDSVFRLNEAQIDAFKNVLRQPANRNQLDIQVIYQYLQNRLQNFNFYSETLSAEEALLQNAGNCLSLAILTNALAKTTNVGVYYELARTPPVFLRENGYSLSSQHIQTVIFEKKVGHAIFYSSKPLELRIDYFSTAGSRTLRRVDVDEFYGMYYSNVAAEALIQNDTSKAYWNLKKAINIDKDSPIALNMLAVLYRNLGYDQYAERVFIHGLSLAENQLELLSNYHRYLLEKNRQQEADRVAAVITDYDDPDPFKWVDLADIELAAGRYENAINFYQKAQRKAPYLHQPPAGIARANFYLGRNGQALSAIKKALENTHSESITALYRAKYDYFIAHKKHPDSQSH